MRQERDYRRLLYTFDTLSDLSLKAVEGDAASPRSLLYLVLGAVAVKRGLLMEFQPAHKRLCALASKDVKVEGLRYCPFSTDDARTFVQKASPLAELEKNGASGLPQPLVRYLEAFHCDFALPLVVRRRLAGILALGPPLGGEFSPHDRSALVTLSRYVGVVLQQQSQFLQLSQAVEENLRLYGALAATYRETVEAFGRAIDAKDVYTRGHSQRVERYCLAMGARYRLPPAVLEGIRVGACLHDIGKIVLENSLLNKPSRLTDEEFRLMSNHTVVGHEVLSRVRFPWPEVATLVRSHHERMDGTGYPDGLKAAELPLHVRIITVADSFDAMTSDRPYRRRLPAALALTELVRCCGTQFDSEVVRAFLGVLREELSGALPRKVFAEVLHRPESPLKARTVDGLLKKLDAPSSGVARA